MMGKYGVFKQGPGSGSLEHMNAWPDVDTSLALITKLAPTLKNSARAESAEGKRPEGKVSHSSMIVSTANVGTIALVSEQRR
jgi:hypothetical protein